MTTAEIFADYLGLTPEGAPWAWTFHEDSKGNELFPPSLTATSPLAEKPTTGWCEALIMKSHNLVLYGPDYQAEDCVARVDGDLRTTGTAAHPTRAVALALLAADPDLRARCEQASDWEAVK